MESDDLSPWVHNWKTATCLGVFSYNREFAMPKDVDRGEVRSVDRWVSMLCMSLECDSGVFRLLDGDVVAFDWRDSDQEAGRVYVVEADPEKVDAFVTKALMEGRF